MTLPTRQLTALVLLAAACGGPQVAQGPADAPDATLPAGAAETAAGSELYPDVVAARATQQSDGTWRFDVTLSSPYDSPQRYADAWRILAPDGTELGVRILTHDHANEQPFTRSLLGVAIPAHTTTVTVQGRDLVSGWGGSTVEVELGGG